MKRTQLILFIAADILTYDTKTVGLDRPAKTCQRRTHPSRKNKRETRPRRPPLVRAPKAKRTHIKMSKKIRTKREFQLQ